MHRLQRGDIDILTRAHTEEEKSLEQNEKEGKEIYN